MMEHVFIYSIQIMNENYCNYFFAIMKYEMF